MKHPLMIAYFVNEIGHGLKPILIRAKPKDKVTFLLSVTFPKMAMEF